MFTYTKYYHGTDDHSAEIIESEGFKGSELKDATLGNHVDDGVVFLADNRDYASKYGSVIFEVTVQGEAQYFGEDMVVGEEREYIVPASAINESGLFRRI